MLARICVAVLGSEGIEARVHGESLGPYRMTVGRMAVIQIWVPANTVELARKVMVEAEIEHVLGAKVLDAITDEDGGSNRCRGAGLGNPSRSPAGVLETRRHQY